MEKDIRKKKYAMVILIIVLLCSFSFNFSFAQGQEKINSIEIDVRLNDDGSATIQQLWDVETYKGTEMFIVMSRMGDMELKNFRVEDENGTVYTFVPEWNTKASLEEKAFKNGILKTKDGFEMCWGKSSYGSHRYKVSYQLTNLVKSYPDSDGFNTRFINDKMTPAVDSAKVTIRFTDPQKNTFLQAENSGIWAFGFDGNVEFRDNAIVAYTTKPLSASNYMNLLVRLDKNIISPTSVGKGSFEDLQKKAFKGSDYGKEFQHGAMIIGGFFAAFGLFGVIFIKVETLLKGKLRKSFKALGGRKKANGYYRQLPMQGSLPKTVTVLDLLGDACDLRKVFQAYILKLIQLRVLIIRSPKEEMGEMQSGFVFKVNTAVRLKDESAMAILDELILPVMDLKNEVTEEKFVEQLSHLGERWLRAWQLKLLREGEEAFELYGFTFGKLILGKFLQYNFTEKGLEETVQIYQFKNFLNDFTLIHEKETKEVELWDDYLVFATLFGMAEVVAGQMKKLNPNFVSQSTLLDEDWTMFSSVMSASAKIYSVDGSGGSASSGGGDGYSGGGSGGGSR